MLAQKRSQTTGQMIYHSLEGLETGKGEDLEKGLVNIVPTVYQTPYATELGLLKGD